MKNSVVKKPNSSLKHGQIWKLGDHKLLCGSAFDPKLINKLLEGMKVQAIIVDPPYGVSAVENKQGFAQLKVNKEILNDNISSETEYCLFSKQWLELALPYLARKNSIYIFNSDKMIFALRRAMDELGINFSQLIIWVKNHSVIGRKDYLLQHELVAFGWYGTHAFRRSKDKSVLAYPKPNSSSLHPTMKPVELISRLILNSTNSGDVIYDCFGGSGTALISAELTNRHCLMVEYDLEYCQTIIDRWSYLTHKTGELIYEEK
ncbi:MAG: site-specific DNA-methyltransferase [Patescibacteria group bacterium]